MKSEWPNLPSNPDLYPHTERVPSGINVLLSGAQEARRQPDHPSDEAILRALLVHGTCRARDLAEITGFDKSVIARFARCARGLVFADRVRLRSRDGAFRENVVLTLSREGWLRACRMGQGRVAA